MAQTCSQLACKFPNANEVGPKSHHRPVRRNSSLDGRAATKASFSSRGIEHELESTACTQRSRSNHLADDRYSQLMSMTAHGPIRCRYDQLKQQDR
jgi:hypothetical protein